MQIRLIVACSNAAGVPKLVPITVSVTEDEYKTGIHYERAKYELGLRDYESPFFCIDEHDSPEMVKLVSDRPDEALHKVLIPLLVEFGEWLDAADDQYGRELNDAFQAAEKAASHYQRTIKART